MIKNPKVSIIIPVYNGENFLSEAIDSALAQDYDNFEIIVVNDGSKDDTSAICAGYSNKIRYFEKENGGVSTALNMGLQNMTGEYFSWLSHDDLYYPEKLSSQIAFLNQYGLMGKDIILYSNYDMIDENGAELVRHTHLHRITKDKPEYAVLRASLNGISLLIPKSAFDRCGHFDVNYRCVQDYLKWQEMFCAGYKFVLCPTRAAKTRVHGAQVTTVSPLVISEGNELWQGLCESVSDERKAELCGSAYSYYEDFAHFLSETPYQEVVNYCKNKCKEIEAGFVFDSSVKYLVGQRIADETVSRKMQLYGAPVALCSYKTDDFSFCFERKEPGLFDLVEYTKECVAHKEGVTIPSLCDIMETGIVAFNSPTVQVNSMPGREENAKTLMAYAFGDEDFRHDKGTQIWLTAKLFAMYNMYMQDYDYRTEYERIINSRFWKSTALLRRLLSWGHK